MRSQRSRLPAKQKSAKPRPGGRGGSDDSEGGNLPASYYAFRNANWLAHFFEASSFVPTEADLSGVLSNAKSYLLSLRSFGQSNVSALANLALRDFHQHGDSYASLAQKVRKRFEVLPWRILVLPAGTRESKESVDPFAPFKTVLPQPSFGLGIASPVRPKGQVKVVEVRLSRGTSLKGSPYEIIRNAAQPRKDSPALIDKLLTSADLLYEIHMRDSAYPCLIFQIEAGIGTVTLLEDVFPAFELALAEANHWPGMLVWNLTGEKSFFPLPADPNGAVAGIQWILGALTKQPRVDLGQIKGQYLEHKFCPIDLSEIEPLHIIHTSDMHLGSTLSNKRLTTIKNRITQLAREYGSSSIVPIVTGDLMDTPGARHLDSVLDYLHFLDNLGRERPVVVLGNHDVRRFGMLDRRSEQALRFYMSPVVWFKKSKVGLLCFNSVRQGHLARGFIDENEFIAIGNELDRYPRRSKDYTLIALLHHHPTPIDIPEWYAQRWYAKWMGGWFDRTIELVNAETFLTWCLKRNVKAVLHGHKHIPRVDEKDGIAILGCGSTTGKVKTAIKGQTYMSINLLSIDSFSGRISCRVRVETVVGSGLADVKSHEILYRGLGTTGNAA